MLRDLLRCYTRPVPECERHDRPAPTLAEALLVCGGALASVLAGAALGVYLG